jgi:hypothetical protein
VKLLSGVLIIAVMFYGMLATDTGKTMVANFIFGLLTNMTIKINGLHKNKIQDIFVHIPNEAELTFSGISMECRSLFRDYSVVVEKVAFNNIEEGENNGRNDKREKKGNEEWIGVRIQNFFIQSMALLQKMRPFLKGIIIKNGNLRLGSNMHEMRDFCYNSFGDKINISGKIGQKHCINIEMEWKDNECSTCNIEYSQDQSPVCGRLIVKDPESRVAQYNLSFQNNKVKVIANGHYQDFLFDIKIDAATVFIRIPGQAVSSGYYEIPCSGNIYPTRRDAFLQSKIFLDDYLSNFEDIPAAVAKNFMGVNGLLTVRCDFEEDLKCNAQMTFRKGEMTLGNVFGIYESGNAKIIGNIPWISIKGFNFKRFECEIDEKRCANIHLVAKEFNAISRISFAESIVVEKFELRSPKGSLKFLEPFSTMNDLSCVFDFNQLDFWEKILPISGSVSGSLESKQGKIVVKCSFPSLILRKQKLSSMDLFYDGAKILTTAKNAEIYGMKLDDLDLQILNNRLDLSGKVNKSGILKLSGEIDNTFGRIALKDAQITSSGERIQFETCVLDFNKHNYSIFCKFFEKKKRGEAKIFFSNEKFSCDFKAFPMRKFLALFNHNCVQGRLEGSISLESRKGYFVGGGRLSLTNLMAYRQNLQMDLSTASDCTKINTCLKNGNGLVVIDVLLPFSIKNDGTISRIPNDLLNCHIVAHTRLERLLILPDNFDLRGLLDCDFRISGSFDQPIISGKGELRGAHIAIGTVLLQNGIVSLSGHGPNIDVLRGEFIDHKKRKAEITGSGQLFFDGVMPNINTNLQLKFNNFSLLRSDNMEIDVLGEGTMSGPVNNMIINGKVTLPKCKILDFTTIEDETGDIQIENDPYLDRKKQKEQQKSFFKYNVNIHCRDVHFVGKIFEMHLRGNLMLSTFQESGTLVGDLQLLEGKLDLFGKRMSFTYGNVTFQEDFPFNPKASFKCQRNFGDMSVELSIINNPRGGISLNIHSTPNNTQDVILSKMLFGKESKYLSVSEAAQLAHAVASLNRHGYIFSVLNTFQHIGIVDSISFVGAEKPSNYLYSNTQNTSEQNAINVSAGKTVHDNVYISVNRGNEEASFDVDFLVSPNISLKANTKGEAGISWKYRY